VANAKFTGYEVVAEKALAVEETIAKPKSAGNEQKKLSFKEKHEFESIEKEMPLLQTEKAALEAKMNDGSMPFDQLQKAAERISEIISLLDEKEMRWLELSERM
jgi:ATP-binding cassette subfamily F protein uup